MTSNEECSQEEGSGDWDVHDRLFSRMSAAVEGDSEGAIPRGGSARRKLGTVKIRILFFLRVADVNLVVAVTEVVSREG